MTDRDFKITFTKTKDRGAYFYNVCVSYVGRNREYMKAIESIIENQYTGLNSNYCLFQLDLSVNFKDSLQGAAEIYDSYVDWDIKSSCILDGFFNKALMRGLGGWEQTKKLKGIGQASLCIILKDIINKNILSETDIISLEASGFIPDTNMKGLVKYYESLGFKQYLPEYESELIHQRTVPMTAKISDILNTCNKAYYSKEIKNLLDDI
jgi:hypothetical protein